MQNVLEGEGLVVSPAQRMSPMNDSSEIEELLRQIAEGSEVAWNALFPQIYGTLHMIAHRLMSKQNGHHTLQTTALVHEAFLKMVSGDRRWETRRHFERVAARAMRCVLVDHARERESLKRGGDRQRELLTEEVAAVTGPGLDVLALDEAMKRLYACDTEAAEVAELRCFGGLSHEQIAGITGRSARTVDRVWRFARSWLDRELEGDHG